MSIFANIADAVNELDESKVMVLVCDAMNRSIDPCQVIDEGLSKGLKAIGKRFNAGEAFIPELMIGGSILKEALKLIEPHIKESSKESTVRGHILLGTVKDDLHDLGKNLVGTILSAAGFRVTDLGKNVAPELFVSKVRALKPEVLGLSALLTTTLANQKEVIDALSEEGLRKSVKIIVGGAPASQEWADKIGADAYGEDAFSSLDIIENLLRES